MNVYLHELRMARGSLVGWIAALVLVMALFLSIFPAFHADVETSRKLLAGFPPQVRAMFGLSMETFFTFLGFYAYTFTYVGVAGAVQGMNMGLTMLSREVTSKTTDFLLTKPLTRTSIFVRKLLAVLTAITVTNIVLVASTLGLTIVFGAGNFSMKVFGLLSLAFLLVQLMFVSIGVLVSQLVRIKSVIAISLGVVFGFFALGMIQSLAGDSILRLVSPFKFFDYMKIVADKTFEVQFVYMAIAVIIIPLVIAYVVYVRHDTRSVA